MCENIKEISNKFLEENNNKFVVFSTPIGKNIFYDLFKNYSKVINEKEKSDVIRGGGNNSKRISENYF